MEEKEEASPSELRIRALTRMYYSKPAIQQALLSFAQGREVVPRYYEGFGKRPDTLQYPADIMALVSRGATSFHGSEEIWSDPLQIQSDMHPSKLAELRISWDLLIDIDSPYLDYAKIAARLVFDLLERQGVKHYGVKFSGSKGFHIIVPGEAFPEEFEGTLRKDAFPEWPRAIVEYILEDIKPMYNRAVTALGVNIEALQRKTKLSKEELVQTTCPNCNHAVKTHTLVKMCCDRCKTLYERPDFKVTKKRIKCTNETCPGFFDVLEEKEFWKCPHCGVSNRKDEHASSNKTIYANKPATYAEKADQEIAGDKLGSLDLVLVSPRHLFRMPYSLHEKTSLASVVLTKSQVATFTPRDADPLRAIPQLYAPIPVPGEATDLLRIALQRKSAQKSVTERARTYAREFEPTTLTGVTEDMFPSSIKILLKGLVDGKKRGLFILITFLRCAGFSDEATTARVFEWNEKNQPPLKEGYVRSQLNWHFKQKKKILPPNYENQSFYKDIGLIEKDPDAKNPLVEVSRALKKKNASS